MCTIRSLIGLSSRAAAFLLGLAVSSCLLCMRHKGCGVSKQSSRERQQQQQQQQQEFDWKVIDWSYRLVGESANSVDNRRVNCHVGAICYTTQDTRRSIVNLEFQFFNRVTDRAFFFSSSSSFHNHRPLCLLYNAQYHRRRRCIQQQQQQQCNSDYFFSNRFKLKSIECVYSMFSPSAFRSNYYLS